VRHLGQRTHGRHHIHDLKTGLLAAQNAFLPGDHDHWHRAKQRVSRAGCEIQCTRAKRRQANAWFAGQPPMRRGHEGRRLFVAGEHQLDGGPPQSLDEIEVLLPRDAEDLLHAFVL